MRSEQSQKIFNYRLKLDAIKQEKQNKELTKTISTFDNNVKTLADAINNMKAPEIDLSEVTEAIKGIKITQPEIKFNPVVKVEAPVVNVSVPADVYARYKRYNSVTEGEGTYHGFLDSDGNWFIQRESELVNGQAVSRYAVGKGNIEKGWSNRKNLDYKPYDRVVIP